MPTCALCGNEFPNVVVIDGKKRILNKRKFCLSCSPFGTGNRKDLTKKVNGKTYCRKCGKYKYDEKFYRRRSRNNEPYGWCKKCTRERTAKRFQELKKKAVEYKGGSCVSCGYNKCLAALEFHHIDPSKKDYQICGSRGLSFEKMKVELDKCVLFCSNCHREFHAGLINVSVV